MPRVFHSDESAVNEHGTCSRVSGDLLHIERPGCITVQRLRIDAEWFDAMGVALDHIVSCGEFWGFAEAERMLARVLAGLTDMSDIEKRIIYVYATNGAEA